MANQSDFLEQLSSLATTVEFDPKYHCETNFIERVWSEAKRIARKKKKMSLQLLADARVLAMIGLLSGIVEKISGDGDPR